MLILGLTGSIGIGLCAAALSVGLQGVDALGEPLSSLRETRLWVAGLSTAYGVTAVAALLSLAFAAAALRAKEISRVMAALALTGAGVAVAASGHAASAEPRWLMRPTVFAHVVCLVLWIGALVPLVALDLVEHHARARVQRERLRGWLVLGHGHGSPGAHGSDKERDDDTTTTEHIEHLDLPQSLDRTLTWLGVGGPPPSDRESERGASPT